MLEPRNLREVKDDIWLGLLAASRNVIGTVAQERGVRADLGPPVEAPLRAALPHRDDPTPWGVTSLRDVSSRKDLRARSGGRGGLGCLRVQKRSDADQEKTLGTDCCRHGDRMKEPITWAHARAPCACAHLEIIGSA